MKVSLRKVEETSGFFTKTTEYCLYVKVELTIEETSAIERAGIADFILVEYSYSGRELNWTVGQILYSNRKGSDWRFVAYNAIARNELEQEVKESLTALKSQIEAQMFGGNKSESFEL